MLMLAIVLVGSWPCGAAAGYSQTRGFLRVCELAAPLGFLAVLAGWTTTEVGRQPWTVYGLLRTADSVSPSLTGGQVARLLLGYTVVYLIMFPAGVLVMRADRRAGASNPRRPRGADRRRPPRPADARAAGERRTRRQA